MRILWIEDDNVLRDMVLRSLTDAGFAVTVVARPDDLKAVWRDISAPERLDAMSRAARRRVEERYSPAAVYPSVAAVYAAAMRRAGSQASDCAIIAR